MRRRAHVRSADVPSTHGGARRRRGRATRGGAFLGLLLLVAAGLLLAVPSALSSSGPPTISSDQADYAPGSTVTLAGANWQPGEAVHIVVNDNLGQTWSYSTDLTADSGGGFTNQFQLPTSFIASYLVTATGPESGSATTTFSDSAAQLDQCTNGGVGETPEPCVNDSGNNVANWGNGDANGQKAHWAEDEFMPYRTTIEGIAAGGHTLTIEYDTVHSSKHALDYLGSFDATETTSATATTLHANNNNPCFDFLPASECTPGSPSGSLPIPDPTLTNCSGSAGTAPSLISGNDSGRSMKIWGPADTTITAMTYVAQNTDQGQGQCSTTLKISFNVGGSDSSNDVVLAWGGHIARGAGFNGWGAGNGAGSVSGSPYHMAFDTTGGLDGASQGSQDHQLRAGPPNGAIIPSSTITIIKNTLGGNDTFGYTTTGGGGLPPSFDITTLGGTGQASNDGINPGSYTITESTPPAGWSFTSLSCTSTGGASTSTTGAEASIEIPVTGGASVTCRYTNAHAATLIVKKLVINDNGGTKVATDFSFTVNGGSATAFVQDGSDPLKGKNTLSVPAGTYNVVEDGTPIAGYTTTYDNCSGSLTSGGSATCTITNNDIAPQLHLRKVLIKDNGGTASAGDWTLTANGTGTNDLSGTTSVDSDGTLQVDTFALSESGGPAGYSASAWSCTGGSQSGSNITVGIGQSATCTITNNDIAPQLTLDKIIVNDNGGTRSESNWTLTANGGTAGTLFGPGAVGNTDVQSTASFKAGTYALSESGPGGYNASAWSCVKNGGAAVSGSSLTLALGDTATCTITNNDQPGTIVIIKNATPAQGVFSFDTTGSTNGPGTSWPTGLAAFTLTGSTANNGNRRTFTVNAGTYTVKEQTQLGWLLTGIGGSTDPLHPYDCVVTGSGGSTGGGVAQSPQTPLDTRTVSIAIKNGETVTCTFENTGNGATRTQGFWATHSRLAYIAWIGGSEFDHTFPGVAGTVGNLSIDGAAPCPRLIDTLGKLMGGFWSAVSTKSNGSKRSALDQARMQLAQQLLAAELNTSAFGSAPAGGVASFTTWESAFCGTDQNAIKNAQQGAASFNSQGDNSTFTPGTSADSKTARSIANIPYWDVLP
jgi:hypothetical protein